MRKGSRHFYRRLLLVYTAILVGVVALLVLYFISELRQQARDTNLEYMEMEGTEGREYILQSMEDADHIHSSLYNSYDEINDLCHYLSDEINSYMEYRLDNYSGNTSVSYWGIEDFMSRMFVNYRQVSSMSVYSDAQKIRTVYEKDGTSRRIYEPEDSGSGEGESGEKGRLAARRELRDPASLQEIGWIEMEFSTEKFQDIVAFYECAQMLVLDEAGRAVYSSSPGLEGLAGIGERELERDYGFFCWEGETDDYRVLTLLAKREAQHIPVWSFLAVLVLGAVSVVIGEIGIHFYLSGIMRRLNAIVDGMENVKTGDLNTRIPCGEKEDELDIIADNFNRMCEDLDAYIKKSYLAEIEQKNAEMAALQSQINPHFLYNTLEAIRMKAICNGDREVGRMLYSMAAMFQSQLKAADVIVLAQELHYSKKYMELFEFRYHDKFRWEVNCEERFLQVPIIKFVIQPVLENYFAHGIRLESDTNFVSLTVRENGAFMEIDVTDNGRGMTEEQREAKNEALEADEFDSHKSMGLANVNRRLRAVYGPECGLMLRPGIDGGLTVTIRFRKEEEERGDLE